MGTLAVKEEGAAVLAAAAALNFVGASVTVTDGGAGTAIVTITDAVLTQEQVEDFVAALMVDTGVIDFTYVDNGAGAGTLTATVIPGSITRAMKGPDADSEIVVAHGNAGATETFDVAAGTVHTATLDANLAVTLTNPPDATHAWTMTLVLTQDATGSRSATWPASVKWPGGVAPTLTTTPGKTDIVTLITYDQGAAWRGFTSGLNYA